MRKFMLIIILGIVVSCSNAQQIKTDSDFETFISIFPLRELPFTASPSSSKNSTPFEVPLPSIPKVYHSKYIEIGQLEKDIKICEKELLSGFSAFARYYICDNFYTIVVIIDADAQCGERNLLVNMNLKGKYIDHLIVYGREMIKFSSSDDKRMISQTHSYEINKDFLIVYETITETKYPSITSNKTTVKTYNIESNGKFKLIKEEEE